MASLISWFYIVDCGCGENPVDLIYNYRCSWLSVAVLGLYSMLNVQGVILIDVALRLLKRYYQTPDNLMCAILLSYGSRECNYLPLVSHNISVNVLLNVVFPHFISNMYA